MNELIKVNYDSEKPTVLGRDLYEALGVKTPYTQWFERMCEYGFDENIDYSSFSQKVKNLKVVDPLLTTSSQSQWRKKFVCYREMKKANNFVSISYRLKKVGTAQKW